MAAVIDLAAFRKSREPRQPELAGLGWSPADTPRVLNGRQLDHRRRMLEHLKTSETPIEETAILVERAAPQKLQSLFVTARNT